MSTTKGVNDRPVCTRVGCGFRGSKALCRDCPDVPEILARAKEKQDDRT